MLHSLRDPSDGSGVNVSQKKCTGQELGKTEYLGRAGRNEHPEYPEQTFNKRR